MDYKEILNSKEWQTKRIEILSRDNHQCQRCGISKTINPTSFAANFSERIVLKDVAGELNGEMKIVNFYTAEDKCTIFCKTSNKIPLIHIANEGSLIINFVLKSKFKYPFNGSVLNNTTQSYFYKDGRINKDIIEILKTGLKDKLDFTRFDIDKEGLYFSAKSNEREYIKSENLHIHHKCYKKNIEVWDQPNNEYVTLCNICHRIIHENQLIPYYNERGAIYQYMKPCWKCGGQRYLECYRHIDNGICYACMGNGYNLDMRTFFNLK